MLFNYWSPQQVYDGYWTSLFIIQNLLISCAKIETFALRTCQELSLFHVHATRQHRILFRMWNYCAPVPVSSLPPWLYVSHTKNPIESTHTKYIRQSNLTFNSTKFEIRVKNSKEDILGHGLICTRALLCQACFLDTFSMCCAHSDIHTYFMQTMASAYLSRIPYRAAKSESMRTVLRMFGRLLTFIHQGLNVFCECQETFEIFRVESWKCKQRCRDFFLWANRQQHCCAAQGRHNFRKWDIFQCEKHLQTIVWYGDRKKFTRPSIMSCLCLRH